MLYRPVAPDKPGKLSDRISSIMRGEPLSERSPDKMTLESRKIL